VELRRAASLLGLTGSLLGFGLTSWFFIDAHLGGHTSGGLWEQPTAAVIAIVELLLAFVWGMGLMGSWLVLRHPRLASLPMFLSGSAGLFLSMELGFWGGALLLLAAALSFASGWSFNPRKAINAR
jgi:hypothetical protein